MKQTNEYYTKPRQTLNNLLRGYYEPLQMTVVQLHLEKKLIG